MGTGTQPIPIVTTKQGMLLNQSLLASRGRVTAGFGIRFFNGFPEKRAGFIPLTTMPIFGIARGAFAWSDLTPREVIGVGTAYKLYYVDDADWSVHDITPLVQTVGPLTNPFQTVAGSATVTVNTSSLTIQPATGQFIDISGAVSFANVTLAGTYQVVTVPDPTHVTITAATQATGSIAGGGTAVMLSSEITPGLTDPGALAGFGTGGFGEGYFGVSTSGVGISAFARFWSVGHFGKIGLFAYNGGGIFSWNPTDPVGTRAALLVPDGGSPPTLCSGLVTTSDNILIAFGTNYNGVSDPLQFWNAAQGDYLNWDVTAAAGPAGAPSTVNRLNSGNLIVDALDLGTHITLLFTDYSVYVLQYTGSQFVFDVQLAGQQCGLIGPNADVGAGNVTYWMGNEMFFQYNGSVNPIPGQDEIKDYVFKNMNTSFSSKNVCWYDQFYNEVIWGIVGIGQSEPSFSAIYNIDEQFWYIDTFPISRCATTWLSSPIPNPLFFGSDGILYQDNTGLDANGKSKPWSITFAPIEMNNGQTWLEANGIFLEMQRQVGAITAELIAYDRTTATDENGDVPILGASINTAAPGQALVDMRTAGRALALTLSGTGLGCDMRLGVPKLDAGAGAGRR